LELTKQVVLGYLMMLVVENQVANQPKLLQLFQLLERLFSQQPSLPEPF
jgi:hypothetical protein